MRHAVAALFCLAALLGTGRGLAADVGPVRVFDAGELAPSRFTVVKRLWTDTWRSSFWIAGHADAGAAITAITTEAAKLGADGIVNLHCLNDSGSYYCYGLAIKLK